MKQIHEFKKMKGHTKITFLVVYDFPHAKLAEQAGLDMLLCGDSVGMAVYGYNGTVPVTMDTMIRHTEAVRRGAPNTFLVGDMPFGSYQTGTKEAVKNAIRFYKEAGVNAIKLEGGVVVAEQVKAIVESGMSVMGHIGLTPQSSGQTGGFTVQGKTLKSAKSLVADALCLEKAGAFAVLVEATPPVVGMAITNNLTIPVIGIGAGPHCDGQLLLSVDMLGEEQVFTPKFVKNFADTDEPFDLSIKTIRDLKLHAMKKYVQEVREGKFPTKQHIYGSEMTPEDEARLLSDDFCDTYPTDYATGAF